MHWNESVGTNERREGECRGRTCYGAEDACKKKLDLVLNSSGGDGYYQTGQGQRGGKSVAVSARGKRR